MNEIDILTIDTAGRTVYALVDGFLETVRYERLAAEIASGAHVRLPNGEPITLASLQEVTS